MKIRRQAFFMAKHIWSLNLGLRFIIDISLRRMRRECAGDIGVLSLFDIYSASFVLYQTLYLVWSFIHVQFYIHCSFYFYHYRHPLTKYVRSQLSNCDSISINCRRAHYNVVLKAVEVGGDVLELTTKSIFDSGDERGTIIDSGTTLAYLPGDVYNPLMEKVYTYSPIFSAPYFFSYFLTLCDNFIRLWLSSLDWEYILLRNNLVVSSLLEGKG